MGISAHKKKLLTVHIFYCPRAPPATSLLGGISMCTSDLLHTVRSQLEGVTNVHVPAHFEIRIFKTWNVIWLEFRRNDHGYGTILRTLCRYPDFYIRYSRFSKSVGTRNMLRSTIMHENSGGFLRYFGIAKKRRLFGDESWHGPSTMSTRTYRQPL